MSDIDDAARYQRLSALVEFGVWSVGKHEVIDSYGNTDELSMNNKSHMDDWLDKPAIIREAASCESILARMKLGKL